MALEYDAGMLEHSDMAPEEAGLAILSCMFSDP